MVAGTTADSIFDSVFFGIRLPSVGAVGSELVAGNLVKSLVLQLAAASPHKKQAQYGMLHKFTITLEANEMDKAYDMCCNEPVDSLA